MKYGTLIDNQLHPAPRAFMLRGAMITNPKAEHFAAWNEIRAQSGLTPYLPVVDERPSTDATHYAVATGWTRDGDTWRRVYEVREVPPPTLADFDAAMEEHLRTERAARGYTTREPDAYINSSVPRWAQDARDWVAHRDGVMAYALALINAVESGQRQPPTMAEFEAGLPTITWTFVESEGGV
jgi:hypothetical protein